MKTIEIRLGNLVYTYSEPNPVKLPIETPFSVSKIELFNVGLKQGLITYPSNGSIEFEKGLSDILPIELTEEWLKKCKVEKFNDRLFIELAPDLNIELKQMQDGWYPILIKDPEMSCEDVQLIGLKMINHVHELQNLYFSLTGEELTFNL